VCGRFTLFIDQADLREAFPRFSFPDEMTPRYNIAPSQPVAVVANNGKSQVEFFQWGLVPSWSQTQHWQSHDQCARRVTGRKAIFRTAYKRRRCLIPGGWFLRVQSVPGKGRRRC